MMMMMMMERKQTKSNVMCPSAKDSLTLKEMIVSVSLFSPFILVDMSWGNLLTNIK